MKRTMHAAGQGREAQVIVEVAPEGAAFALDAASLLGRTRVERGKVGKYVGRSVRSGSVPAVYVVQRVLYRVLLRLAEASGVS